MPKQNRPLVRDGRLQAPKKRTDRSYLSPAPSVEDDALPESAGETVDAADELPEDAAASLADAATVTDPAEAFAAPEPAPAAPPMPVTPPPSAGLGIRADAGQRTASSRLPTAVRALQQQGVRKRRDVDLDALAVRDTNYALHELRRIAILTIMVIITLTVLTFVLR